MVTYIIEITNWVNKFSRGNKINPSHMTIYYNTINSSVTRINIIRQRSGYLYTPSRKWVNILII